MGLGGSIYDITRFLPPPGSQETLTEVCDGSEHFDIGHAARGVLANEFVIYSPYEGDCLVWLCAMRDKERERLTAVGAGSVKNLLSSSSSSSSRSRKGTAVIC